MNVSLSWSLGGIKILHLSPASGTLHTAASTGGPMPLHAESPTDVCQLGLVLRPLHAFFNQSDIAFRGISRIVSIHYADTGEPDHENTD